MRWGVCPDGGEWNFGSTVTENLETAEKHYRAMLSEMGYRFVAPLEIEGTDFAPLMAKSSKGLKVV